MTSTAPQTSVSTTLAVKGMTCGHCVRHVTEALGEIPGVRAEVDLAGATATISHPPSVGVQTLVATVAEAGYEADVVVA